MSVKKLVERWWSENPMTYAPLHGKTEYKGKKVFLGEREFFDQVDATFYKWNYNLHGYAPFSKIFDYKTYKGKNVLEIGCGMGTMAMNWAQQGARVTAIDLNHTSIEQTQKRFSLNKLTGNIVVGDGNALVFEDQSFDYVYSWGVLHHSPNLEKSISEMMRVLKSGGQFGLMLYNRQSFLHWYMTQYIEGFLHLENDFLNQLQLASRYGDGNREEGNPHTWPVTRKEMKNVIKPYSSNLKIRSLGTELDDIFLYMLPGLGMILPRFVKKPWARRWGWSLWIYGTKD